MRDIYTLFYSLVFKYLKISQVVLLVVIFELPYSIILNPNFTKFLQIERIRYNESMRKTLDRVRG